MPCGKGCLVKKSNLYKSAGKCSDILLVFRVYYQPWAVLVVTLIADFRIYPDYMNLFGAFRCRRVYDSVSRCDY